MVLTRNPTMPTKEMDGEKDEQIVVVLERETRKGGYQIEVCGEKEREEKLRTGLYQKFAA